MTRFATLLLLSTAIPASADTITVTGTIAPLLWQDGKGFLPSQVIDTAGAFGTPGDALAGDAFSVLWTYTDLTIESGVLTVNGQTVSFAAAGAGHVSLDLHPTNFYANITTVPGLAMNTFLHRDGGGLPTADGFASFSFLTDNLTTPHQLGGGFRLSGFDAYFFLDTLTVGNPVLPVPLGSTSGLPFLLLLLWRLKKGVDATGRCAHNTARFME